MKFYNRIDEKKFNVRKIESGMFSVLYFRSRNKMNFSIFGQKNNCFLDTRHRQQKDITFYEGS